MNIRHPKPSPMYPVPQGTVFLNPKGVAAYEHSVDVSTNIRVNWSNGHGFSVYKLIDDPNAGPHHLSLIAEYEADGRGGWTKVSTK